MQDAGSSLVEIRCQFDMHSSKRKRSENLRVTVWRCETSNLRDLFCAVYEDIVLVNSIASSVGVQIGDYGKFGIEEVILLNKDLSAHSCNKTISKTRQRCSSQKVQMAALH